MFREDSIRSLSGAFALFVASFVCGGCSLLQVKEPDSDPFHVTSKNLSPEQQQELAAEVGGGWLYGQGFGDALIAVGGIVIFPPYAVYVLGNGALSLAGYEPLLVTNLLPEDVRSRYTATYDTIASGPGRMSAFVAGEEYRDADVIKRRISAVVGSGSEQTR